MIIQLRTAQAALLALTAIGCAMQSASANDSALTFTLENDTLTGSDNSYTNGVGITWVSADLDSYNEDSFVRKWGAFWSFLPFVSDDGYTTYASWSFAQEMHTPEDIGIADPPEGDQPYAGVMYVDSLLYARSERSAHVWELKLGTAGPSSQADNTQKWFHNMIGGKEPKGWHTQIPDEPVINVGYTTAYLWKKGSAGGSAEWRLVPVGSASLGTYFTGVGLGVYGEVGWNLVNALGGTSLRQGLNAASTVGVGPVDGWSVSFFGGIGGHAVAHYLPLDGTVFKDSRSVDTEPFVGSTSVGMAVRHNSFVLSLAATFTTDAFEAQPKSAEFGTLSMSWYF
jgi:lipid A 3-O-deacylase